MPKCGALRRDGCKLGRPNEVDGVERVDCRRFPLQEVDFHAFGRTVMQEFIHRENLALFKRRLAEPRTDAEREVLMKLLTAEEAKEWPPQKPEARTRA
jgi:hypothetical protein